MFLLNINDRWQWMESSYTMLCNSRYPVKVYLVFKIIYSTFFKILVTPDLKHQNINLKIRAFHCPVLQSVCLYSRPLKEQVSEDLT